MYKTDSDQRILLIVLINRLLGLFFDSPVRVFTNRKQFHTIMAVREDTNHGEGSLSATLKDPRPKKAAKAVKHFNLNTCIP
jgi:hypothetical protein